MKHWVFFCITLWVLQLHSARAGKKMVNASKIVEYINTEADLPWKADTYGASQVDVKLFVRDRMGLILPGSVNFTRSNPQNLIKKATLKPDNDGTGLPIEFTWTATNRTNCSINHIRDQSNCGSCWAVSTASAFGDRVCIQSKGKYNATLSQEYITACNTRNYGCSGGYMDYVNNFLVANGTITGGDHESDDGCQQYTIRPCGFPSTSQMPCVYRTSRTPTCNAKKCNNDWYPHTYEPDTKVFKARSWYFASSDWSLSREDLIRDEIYRNGPVTAVFWVLQDFMFYREGVYVPSPRGWYLGGHAVRVIGWGVQNRLKYWHAANSWGTGWGEKGFFKIIRGVNAVSFERAVSIITPDL